MGTCLSLDSSEEKKSNARSKEIDKQLLEMKRQEKNVIKILILGTGESGKSTLVKQMKIIHNEGYTKEEMISFKVCIIKHHFYSYFL
jgi:guanine nucleotide-binding protein subunit alpha